MIKLNQIKYKGSTALIVLVFFVVVAVSEGATSLVGNVEFEGNLTVTGAMSKGAGTFLIDHPLDPKNKLLYHSFVESPDVKNLYDGIAVLDEEGTVTIQLPSYFEALNEGFRYQFFPHDQSMPNLYIVKEVENNSFSISGGEPNGRISWQVTGIRHDPYILANPIIPEVDKGPDEIRDKGEYLFEGYEEDNTASERISLIRWLMNWLEQVL